jgi:hypothetical protein
MATEGGEYEWNMAFHTFRRLQSLLAGANEFSVMDNFVMWYKYLDALKREVSVYLGKGNKKEKQVLEGLEELRKKCFVGYKNYVIRFNNNNFKKPNVPITFRENLGEFHQRILEILENKKILLKKGKEYKPDVW